MVWGLRWLAVCALVAVASLLAMSGSAMALDAADTITLTAPSGTSYSAYPFSFTGSGTVDGADAGNYGVQVLFVTASSSTPSICPQDYGAADQAIEMDNGGTDVYNSAIGLTDPALLESGGYEWSAEVNGDITPTVTTPGNYLACAYLVDDLTNETFAVSNEVPFTVSPPKGSNSVPQGFGGPPGKKEPAGVTLTVKPRHAPIRAPGLNFIVISGRFDPTSGEAGLVLTIKPTARYNGCAPNDQEDSQIARADGGAVLTPYEKVTGNSNGDFQSFYALKFKKAFRGTAVICAYLSQGIGDDVAFGYERFTTKTPVKRSHHRTKRHHHR